MGQEPKTDLRFLIYEEEGYLVIQCLEHDIRAQAKTPKRLFKNFRLSFEAALQEGLETIGPAPDIFERMWTKRKQLDKQLATFPQQLELPANRHLDFAFA